MSKNHQPKVVILQIILKNHLQVKSLKVKEMVLVKSQKN